MVDYNDVPSKQDLKNEAMDVAFDLVKDDVVNLQSLFPEHFQVDDKGQNRLSFNQGKVIIGRNWMGFVEKAYNDLFLPMVAESGTTATRYNALKEFLTNSDTAKLIYAAGEAQFKEHDVTLDGIDRMKAGDTCLLLGDLQPGDDGIMDAVHGLFAAMPPVFGK